jgi:hypothetical protein
MALLISQPGQPHFMAYDVKRNKNETYKTMFNPIKSKFNSTTTPRHHFNKKQIQFLTSTPRHHFNTYVQSNKNQLNSNKTRKINP